MNQIITLDIVEINSDSNLSLEIDAQFRELAEAELLYVGGGAGEVIPG